MKTKFYLDKRSPARALVPDNGGIERKYPVKISINHKGSSAYLPTGIEIEERYWVSKPGVGCVVNCTNASRLNIVLAEKKLAVDKTIEGLREKGELHGATASEIRERVAKALRGKDGDDGEARVLFCFMQSIESKKKEGTKRVYQGTVRRLLAYPRFKESMTFRDITPDWLYGFNEWLMQTSPSANARAIHFRNIHSVYNDAIRDGLTSSPTAFKKFKIRYEPTKDRSLTAKQLRALRDADLPSPAYEKYRDLFFLSFYLCGMNLIDILDAVRPSGDRVEKIRIKTGQPLSIGIIPEARAIINKYPDSDKLVSINKGHNYGNFERRLNKYLKRIGTHYNPHTKEWEGEPIVPDLSFYYARYAWATIAGELDIPERTVGMAMGHSTAKAVTSIYMRVDMRKKVDGANRAVIDFTFIENLENKK